VSWGGWNPDARGGGKQRSTSGRRAQHTWGRRDADEMEAVQCNLEGECVVTVS
jgi:hypothetical protein